MGNVMVDRLVLFYLGGHPDHRGRFLAEILQKDDFWFEVTHDHIQWLFPNDTFSRVVPDAPTLTAEVREYFVSDTIIRSHILASYRRFIAFLGLSESTAGLVKAENWAQRKGEWFTEETHNCMRITRVLKCLCAIEMLSEANQLFACIESLCSQEEDCGLSPKTREYWRSAVAQQGAAVRRPRLRRGRG